MMDPSGKITTTRITAVDGWLLVQTPFNHHFVTALKTRIPSYKRRYDAGNRGWLVSPQYLNLILSLINHYYGVSTRTPEIFGVPPDGNHLS